MPTSNAFEAQVTATSQLGYPRVAGFVISDWITGNHSTVDIDRFSLCDLFVLNFGPSASHPRTVPGTGLTDQGVLDRFRSNNPDIAIIQFVNAPHTAEDNSSPSNSYRYDYETYLEAQTGPTGAGFDWFAYNLSGVRPTGDWPGNKFLNWSPYVTADSNGDKVAEWVAKKRYNDNYANATYNGYLVDVQRTEPNPGAQNLDFNGDGTTNESALAGNGATLYKDFELRIVTQMNALIGGSDHVTMGNNGNTWVPFRNFTTPLPQYDGMNNGGFLEGAMGKPFSPDIWGAGNVNVWKNNISKNWIQYCDLDAHLGVGFHKPIPAAQPAGSAAPLVIFGSAGSWTDYATFRYTLCSCLLGNGYINYQAGTQNGALEFGDWQDYDEYKKGTANERNWLGLPVDGMIDASVVPAWSNGVYAREFENGAIFVNPDGNGNQTIDPTNFKGGLWKRLNGTQDASVNNGNNITGPFTLNDRDGLVVARQ